MNKPVKYSLLLLVIMAVFLSLSQATYGAVSDWQKGVSLYPRWNTDFGSDSFKKSVDKAVLDNVNYISLIIPYYQSNIYTTDVKAGGNTPTDQSLINAIQYLHSKGLKVNLKPHVDSYDYQWRANINPGDRQGWFLAYGGILNHLADIGAQNGVEEITIGTELINMSADDTGKGNTVNWNSLIGNIRQKFFGKLTYSANWGSPGWTDEKNRIQFWGSLDYIGISAYFPLPSGDNSVNSLKMQWQQVEGDISSLQKRFNKSILFTEVGYRNISGARYAPFEFSNGGNNDQTEQANLYEALFSFWNNYSYMAGVQWWDWSTDPNAGGSGNTDFTVQNKLAETVMKNWFAGSPPPTPPPPGGSVGFIASASASPGNVSAGQNTTISASVKNNGSAIGNVVVDVEVYNAGGQKVFQKFFEGQQFTASEIKIYSVSFVPSAGGDYTVKLGVFNQSWITNYFWIDKATTITVSTGGGSAPPPASGGTIEIWWPTNNVSVSGDQPFKAIVSGRELGAYQMSWQVDGGTLNTMYNSDVGYPHKEAMVNVSAWNWKGSGPYKVNIVARDSQGNTVGQKEIIIYIN